MHSTTSGATESTTGGRASVAHATSPARRTTLAQRGQVLVIFAMSILVLVGFVAIVVDVSWYWSNSLKVQRAADAAALAGAVDLPARPGTASVHPLGTGVGDALAEASKNGYANGGGVTVTPVQDSVANTGGNANQMDVTISAPVQTFFMRVFGIQTITATRTSKALFTLPVPMGSPENYYGVFGPVRNATFTGTTTTSTTYLPPTNVDTTVTWATPNNIDNKATPNNSTYTISTATDGSQQAWRQWNFGIPAGATIIGIQAQVNAKLASATTATNCTIGIQLSPNGSNWYPSTPTPTPGLNTTELPYTLGSAANTTLWAGHTWVQGDFSSNSSTGFHARLTWNRGGCASSQTAKVDTFTVQVTYSVTTTSPQTNLNLTGPGPACVNGAAGCAQDTGGQALNPRGFWGTMNTEGAANVNGDAYQPFYDNPTSSAAKTCPSAGDACYDSFDYYNYAISMPPDTSGGYVWIYDPVFCATGLSSGTGDRWFGSAGTNVTRADQVSSWYELFADPNNTPYNLADDSVVASSGNLFRDIRASDSTMSGPTGSNVSPTPAECRQTGTAYGDGRDYHDSWYLLNPGNPLTGGPNGTVYRLHTTSTVPTGLSDPVNQKNSNGEQSFAIFATDFQGGNATPTNPAGTAAVNTASLPDVYGLGAMQMFTPLSSTGGTTSSQFYLARVPAFYAGKTLELNLWDPGDTSPLSASLSILMPTSPTVLTAEPFTYSATVGTTNSGANSACASNQNTTGTTSVQTSTGASLGLFNGCWLTLEIPIPSTYAGDQSGWWQIRYTMNGSGTSSDVTTWTAAIKGNPVHLVVP